MFPFDPLENISIHFLIFSRVTRESNVKQSYKVPIFLRVTNWNLAANKNKLMTFWGLEVQTES